MGKGRTVIVKFRHGGDLDAQHERLKNLVGKSLIDARQLFPGDEEEELATIYELAVDARAPVKQVISGLEGDEQIEYAHEPASRRPE